MIALQVKQMSRPEQKLKESSVAMSQVGVSAEAVYAASADAGSAESRAERMSDADDNMVQQENV